MGKLDFSDVLTDDEDKEHNDAIKNHAEENNVPRLEMPKKKKEKQRQLNCGLLPEFVIEKIDDFARQHKDIRIRRVLILKALKAYGVPIPDDLLRDRRRGE